MDRSQHRQRQINRFRPQAEPVEGRLLLSLGGVAAGALGPNGFLNNPPGTQAVRPNTPVLPFGSTLAKATFIDPSAHVFNGNHTVIGSQTDVAPYVTLDSTTGFIKIGSRSDILDNATIVSNPNGLTQFPSSVRIGDQVSVGYGATVLGPSVIGAYGTSSKPTGIGPNAVIDGATIEPGAVVGALARVGPGVTVPAGYYVLPGSNVTTDAEASDPTLGMVQKKVPDAVQTALAANIARYPALAAGYTNLYQGNSATGANIGTSTTGINNGNLSVVEGAGPEPGNATATVVTGIAFEPTAATPVSPSFVGPFRPAVPANLFNFPARVIGDVRFAARASLVEIDLGRSNSIRADQGQPITFASAPVTGRAVTITSPGGGLMTTSTTTTTFGVTRTTTTTKTTGAMKFGLNFSAGGQSVILGGTAASYTIGDDVTVGPGAVVSNSSIGAGATIGARAYVAGSTVAVGQTVPAGEILINNKVVGQIQW